MTVIITIKYAIVTTSIRASGPNHTTIHFLHRRLSSPKGSCAVEPHVKEIPPPLRATEKLAYPMR